MASNIPPVIVPIEANTRPLEEQLRSGVGKLDAFARSTEQVGKRVDTLTTASKSAANATDAHAGAIRKVIPLVGNAKDRFGGLKETIGGYKTALEGSNTAGSRAPGIFDGMAKSASGYATKMLTVTAALAAGREALQGYARDAELAAASLRETEGGRRDIATISDTPQQQAAFQQRANRLSVKHGLNRAETLDLVFKAKSDEVFEDVGDIAESSILFGADTASVVAGKVPKLFPDALSTRQALSATFVGARQSNANPQEFGRVLPMSAEASVASGMTSAEGIAALSTLTSHFGTPAAAAERLRALNVAISRTPEIAGKGLVGGMHGLQEMSDEDRAKALSDQGARAAFDKLIKDIETFAGRLEGVSDDIASNGAALGVGLAVRRSDPKYIVEADKRRAIAEKEIRDEPIALAREVRETARMRRRTSFGPVVRGVSDVLDTVGIPGTQVDLLGLAEGIATKTRELSGKGPLAFDGSAAMAAAIKANTEELKRANAAAETITIEQEVLVIDSLP